jgi:hypothetical protein
MTLSASHLPDQLIVLVVRAALLTAQRGTAGLCRGSRVRASKRVRTRTTARASRHEEHASPSQLGGGLNGVAADLHMWILAR